ncbi:MAG: endo-1,4-beta-xylanase [Treponema sp.]|nr:endo-1,4-beta-xylanase [Treponema sp.]
MKIKKLSLMLGAAILSALLLACSQGADSEPRTSWTDESVTGLKDAYEDYFDSFGIACEYKPWNRNVGELQSEAVREGLSKHADSITMGNEFKPDSFFSITWGSSTPSISDETFTASNGKTIEVPVLNGLTQAENCLQACKDAGLKMRGHVLTWHSQTPDAFFAEDYNPTSDGELLSNLVDEETMTARHEWYIKTVMDFVAEWETENNNGEHIIWAWDVVNEAIADDAQKTYEGDNQDWLRGSSPNTKDKSPSNGGSRWYQIYGDDEFIINAFRFANAYAPSDVELCYNDYNEYMDYSGGWKTSGILHLIEEIKAGQAQTIGGNSVAPRIDVIGMQSHVGESWPEVSSYEAALKRFLASGLKVHITEFDISTSSQDTAADLYKDYFSMLIKYGKKYSSSAGIENVTVWGISSQDSWINSDGTKFPLLFDRDSKNNYYTNASFDAVINVVSEDETEAD